MARFLGSARGRLLAVVDTKAALDAIFTALKEAGIAPEAIEIFRQHDGATSFDRFALFQTEEYERWHGKEPDLPGFMRR